MPVKTSVISPGPSGSGTQMSKVSASRTTGSGGGSRLHNARRSVLDQLLLIQMVTGVQLQVSESCEAPVCRVVQ